MSNFNVDWIIGIAPLFGNIEHCSSYGQSKSYSNGICDETEKLPEDIRSSGRSLRT